MTKELSASNKQVDIVEELELRGDDLSLRAARYIRIKRLTLEGVERTYRSLCHKTLEGERHG